MDNKRFEEIKKQAEEKGTLTTSWYEVRARRVDNNEWKGISYHGLELDLIDKDFCRSWIMCEKEGKSYLRGEKEFDINAAVEVKPETLEYAKVESDERGVRLSKDDELIYIKLEVKENAIKEIKKILEERKKNAQ